jgi:hypothetical protein
VEMDSPSARSTQVGGGRGETLFRQNLDCSLAIQSSDRWSVSAVAEQRKDIGATKHFHFKLITARSESVELPGQVSNAEVDITLAFGQAEPQGQGVRTAGQDAMAQCTGAQPLAPKRDAHTRSENRSQNGGSARKIQFSRLEIQVWKNVCDFDHRGFL